MNCYLSEYGYCVDMCHNSPGNNNLTFMNNTFATDLRWVFGHIYNDYSVQFGRGTGNIWSGNKLKVYPGSSPDPMSHVSTTGLVAISGWTLHLA